MKKCILTLTIIILFNLTICSITNSKRLSDSENQAENLKDFIKGYLLTSSLTSNGYLNGNEYLSLKEKLTVTCLNNSTKNFIKGILMSFKDKNTVKVIQLLKEKVNFIKCEKLLTEKTQKSLNNLIEEGLYIHNIKKNFLEIAKIIIAEIDNEKKTAFSVGVEFAKIEKNLVVKENTLALASLKELEEITSTFDLNIKFDKKSFKLFSLGILIGVSSSSFENNECYKILKGETIDLNDFIDLFNHIKDGIKHKSKSEFSDAIKKLIELLYSFYKFDAHCDIRGLVKGLRPYLNTGTGFSTLVYKIMKSPRKYFKDVKLLGKNLKNKKWGYAGQDLGRILSNLIGWRTN